MSRQATPSGPFRKRPGSRAGPVERQVGKTTVAQDYKEGAPSIIVSSVVDLFGPLVELVKVDGVFSFKFVHGVGNLTIQVGRSLCVNVTEVVNNEIKVTPISVRAEGKMGDQVMYGCTGAFGLVPKGLKTSPKIDFDLIKQEVEELEQMGVYDKKEGQIGSAQDSGAGGNLQFSQPMSREREAEVAEASGDELFWDGLLAEKKENTDRILYCPIFDGDCFPGLEARLKYTEALRHFNNCVELDKSKIEYLAKRCATLCKLRMFEKALPDANNYTSLHPEFPTGYCLKGCAYHGLKQYNNAIAAFQEGLEVGTIAMWDDSRVWTIGTVLSIGLKCSVDRRDAIAEQAKVSNQHGVHWREILEYDKALPCLHEAVALNAQALGVDHMFYGTCVNNLGACLEAMGNYQDAMKQYTKSLRVTERASRGRLRILLVSGRHLPHATEKGVWEGEVWQKGGMSVDPYVTVELQQSGHRNILVKGNMVEDSYQPAWNQVINLKSENGTSQLTFQLYSQNRKRVLLESHVARVQEGMVQRSTEIKKLEEELDIVEKRAMRLREFGKAKQQELNHKLEEMKVLQNEIDDKRNLQNVDNREAAWVQSRTAGLDDVLIGQFKYDMEGLAAALDGQAQATERKWFDTLDQNGKQVRGEDFGVAAIQVEMTWIPEDVEYPSRLSNIGNLWRIMGDQYSSRTGHESDANKLGQHYDTSQRILEEALRSMKTAKSIPTEVQKSDILEELNEKMHKASNSTSKQKDDGEKTLEYLTVLENLATLHQSRAFHQLFQKGTPETVKAQFAGDMKQHRAAALQRIEEAMRLRKTLYGDSGPEYRSLLQGLVTVHIEMENFRDAFPLQEKVVAVVRSEFGEGSDTFTREITILNQLHALLGRASVKELTKGSWKIDSTESWHWEMVELLAKRTAKSSKHIHKKTVAEDESLQATENAMLQEKVRLFNPPPITNYSRDKMEDESYKQAHMAALTHGDDNLAPKRTFKAKVVASKLQTPETELVRMDIQGWPMKSRHTLTS